MGHLDQADIRKRLEDERAALHAQLNAFPVENQTQRSAYGGGHHPADDATDLFLRERNIPLRSHTHDQIAQIDAALQRLDEGTYGVCARCGNPIASERLEAMPSATLCLNCQSLVEQNDNRQA